MKSTITIDGIFFTAETQQFALIWLYPYPLGNAHCLTLYCYHDQATHCAVANYVETCD